MKILSLKSENVKRLSVVEVIPKDKGLVIIAGKNGAGKSAVLDSIMYALAGEDSIPTKPVRRGEDKAKVELDLEPFAQKARAVESTNAKVRANKQKKELRGQFKEKTKQSEALTEKIEALEKGKKRRISEAKFPVEGLSLSDTKEVEFNGIPFDQVNTAEQLRISMAMGMVMNPKLRVLLIRQGNDLDPDSFKLIGDMAVAGDYQVWIEKVDPTGRACVIIEDGHVKAEQPEQKELV